MRTFTLIFVFTVFCSFLPAQESIPYHNLQPILFTEDPGWDAAETLTLPQPPDNDDTHLKSVGKAFFLSLVIPGAGELYMAEKGHASFFFGVEVLTWAGLLVNNIYADHLIDEYKTYAVQHAGIAGSEKDKQYWIDIGKFDDIYEFNDQRRRDRYFEAIYEETDANYWMWDSRENRHRYDGKRIRANEIASQDVYFFAGIMLNHLVSGINAMRLARTYNSRVQDPVGWSLKVDSHRETNWSTYLGLSLTARF